MEANLTCPKCSGSMEEGFIVDQSEAYYVAKWYLGPPKFARFLGGLLYNVVVNTKLLRSVVTYRCAQCGFLESYAP